MIKGGSEIGYYVALLLLAFIALPGAIWFARDALVARLNPWVWATWGFLSIVLPVLLLFRLERFLGERGLLEPMRGKPWGGIISLTIIGVGWVTAYMLHKRLLRPRRVANIGLSLNYVGGWLAYLIYVLLLSAGLSLLFYIVNTYTTLLQLCPSEQTWGSLFRCAITSTPNIWETVMLIITVAGCLWAALALIRKTSSAIRITGCVLLCLLVFGLLPTLEQALDVVMTDDARERVKKIQRFDQRRSEDLKSGQIVWSVIWLGYLIRSKRVRQVYGRNLLQVPEPSPGSRAF